jgi:predicted DNA-binding transcriptional regulator AlpA
MTAPTLETDMTGKELVDHKGLLKLGIRFCKVHLTRKEEKSEFPLSFKLGTYDNSPRVWYLCEVLDWIENCAATRLPTALK